MFQKKKDGDDETPRAPGPDAADPLSAPPLKPFTRKGVHVPPKAPQVPAFRSEIPRRSMDIPGASRRPREEATDTKKLTVGRDICLAGDITSCDKLLVEGRVEASLSDARIIEVAETGIFKGSAEVDEADISGRFEGQLTVRDRLVVRATGHIIGTVRYGRLVVEDGGALVGDLALLEREEPPASLPAPSGPSFPFENT